MLSLAQSYAEDLEEHQQKPEDAFVSQIQKRNEELEAENRKLRELMQAKGNGEVPDQNWGISNGNGEGEDQKMSRLWKSVRVESWMKIWSTIEVWTG